MKKIYHILLIMLAMSFGLIACTEETPFSTATENDDPRILDPLFPDRVNGELPVVSNIDDTDCDSCRLYNRYMVY